MASAKRKTKEERSSKALQVATRRQTRSMSTHDSKLDSSFSVSKPQKAIAKAEAECLPKKKSEAGAKSRSKSKSRRSKVEVKTESELESEPDASSVSDSKAEAEVHVKLETPVAVVVPTPEHVTTRKRKRTHTVSSHAIDPVYKYSNKQIAGVTSIQTYGEPPGGGRWRYIRSEYQLPVQKVHPDEGGQEGRESGDSRDEVILIQNQLSHSLYALIVQAILWNQTAGRQARPVLDELLRRYPDPKTLAKADFDELVALLYPIGLYNSRARRLIDMANTWVKQPPLPGRGYAKVRDRKYTDIPLPDLEDLEDTEREAQEADGEQVIDVKPEISKELQIEEAHKGASAGFWEIAHLPGIGPYALDSFRIFHRDEMRGLAADWLGKGAGPGFEPEWKRVVAADKDLRAYLRYLWAAEGWDWDVVTGKRKKIIKEDMA